MTAVTVPKGRAAERRKRASMGLLYAVFDMAVCVIAIRSFLVLGAGSPWTRVGWVATACWGVSAALRYVVPGPPANLLLLSTICFGALTLGFLIGAVRDEPQAEPLMWPRRIGLTRAQKR